MPGVATGLAVTGAGGDVLFVEATAMDGEVGLQVTGQLGDVMKESAQIALSWVRSHREDIPVDADDAGAPVPRALPRRGGAQGRSVRRHRHDDGAGLPADRAGRCGGEVGMTGEVTLSGRVLPIGGVKQKVLAAHRAGLTEVILPARNGPDLDDLPDEVRAAMTVHLVDDVAEVLDLALAA